ncbi:hypothetical protein [Quadrisphaera sp. KR29]|uniref:hypothetical protein n=1 Tax=Quadrisphaera sp. KR29 TaxID=3461391 RepID=UPI0040442B9C
MTDEDVIYGWYAFHETWAVIGAEDAELLAGAVQRAQAATTVGEMRAVYTDVGDGLLPATADDWLSDLEDDDGDVDDAAEYSWSQLPGVEDGDWPPMPSRLTLALPQDVLNDLRQLPGVKHEDTVLNGDYLVIPRAAEADLVKVLTTHRYRAKRDDATVYALAGGDALYG